MYSIDQNITDLVRASSGLKTNLEYLSTPAGKCPGLDSDRTITIPSSTLLEFHAHHEWNSLQDLFRPLRDLYLSLDTDNIMNYSSYSPTLGEKWLCNALQSMRGVENMELRFVDQGQDAIYGLFNILLTRDFELPPPSKTLIRRPLCHSEFTLESGTSRHSDCWRAVWDHPEVPSLKAAQIRVLEPNPWPRIQRLALSGMYATKGDPASLFITIAGSLRELELSGIVVGKCPCWITPDRGWGRWREGTQSWNTISNPNPDGEPWYDTLVMISNVLDLRKSKINLLSEDRYCLTVKLAKILGLHKESLSSGAQPSALDTIFAEYIVKGEGEGLALWLSKTFVLEREMSWDCLQRK